VACNLCCDGSLFNRVGVEPEEKERLQEKGRFYTKSNGEIRMRLGCQYLGDNGACECYKQRPKKCRRYQCELLRSVEAGITAMEDAVSIVQEARQLRDKSKQASEAAIVAGGGSMDGREDVNGLIKQVEEQLNLSAPIPAPAVALAKYRYRCFVQWIRLYIKSDHLT
jgi:Fe-S-cluster containining protein